MFEQCFQCKFAWNKVKHARIMMYVICICFTALTLAGSFKRCLWTQPICIVFKTASSGTLQLLMHEKTCEILILVFIV